MLMSSPNVAALHVKVKLTKDNLKQKDQSNYERGRGRVMLAIKRDDSIY